MVRLAVDRQLNRPDKAINVPNKDREFCPAGCSLALNHRISAASQ
jgi:hypothetical protein